MIQMKFRSARQAILQQNCPTLRGISFAFFQMRPKGRIAANA